MTRYLLAVTALIFLTLVESLGAGEPVSAELPALTPQLGMLVLRNGRIIEGEVTRAGDRFLVAMGERDEVTVPATAVEFFCRDLAQAYQLKQASLRFGKLDDVLDLAEWCLRHQLHQEAAEQMLRGLALDHDDPRIGQLERRLQVTLQARTETVPADEPTKLTIGAEEIELALDDLPPGAVERFTSQVQPLLLNRCGAGRCHGPQSSSGFRLTHPISGYRLTTRMTQRNLFHTLKQVSRTTPQASRLLTIPARPHGDLVTPVFSEHEQDKLLQLESWVVSLGTSPDAPSPASIRGPNSILLQPTGNIGNYQTSLRVPPGSQAAMMGGVDSQVRRASFETDAGSAPYPTDAASVRLLTPDQIAGTRPIVPRLAPFDESSASPTGFPLPLPGEAGPPVQPGLPGVLEATGPGHAFGPGQTMGPNGPSGQTPAFVPRDAFDPELFNRRFFPERDR